mmetsp:Transcript_27197/g.49085  ORF Transcript_27197/g.49085 Transcript_27197/m.49085 type:complete len:213 (-) Transcript_27197:326-964(-)
MRSHDAMPRTATVLTTSERAAPVASPFAHFVRRTLTSTQPPTACTAFCSTGWTVRSILRRAFWCAASCETRPPSVWPQRRHWDLASTWEWSLRKPQMRMKGVSLGVDCGRAPSRDMLYVLRVRVLEWLGSRCTRAEVRTTRGCSVCRPSKTVPWLMETDMGALDVDVMVAVTCRNAWEKVAFMRARPLRMAQYSQLGSLVRSCRPTNVFTVK